MKVILDTNMLILPFTTSINLDIEFAKLGIVEVYVPTAVIYELEQLALQNANARAALTLIKKYQIVKTHKNGDAGVIEAAMLLNAAVATNDKVLRNKLKLRNIKRIVPRQRAYLVIES